MSWAKHAKERLLKGETVTVKPRGYSMKGRVNDGDTVVLSSCKEFKVDDIVLVRVKGCDYLHLIKAIDGKRFLIGNNRGRINGWVGRRAIFGIAERIIHKGT